MAWARQSYAFGSSSQAHAILMAPLPKMQRVPWHSWPPGYYMARPLGYNLVYGLSPIKPEGLQCWSVQAVVCFLVRVCWSLTLWFHFGNTVCSLCLSIRYKTINDGLGDYDTRRYTTCRWTHSHWLNDRRPCTRNGTCPWMYTPNQQLKNNKR